MLTGDDDYELRLVSLVKFSGRIMLNHDHLILRSCRVLAEFDNSTFSPEMPNVRVLRNVRSSYTSSNSSSPTASPSTPIKLRKNGPGRIRNSERKRIIQSLDSICELCNDDLGIGNGHIQPHLGSLFFRFPFPIPVPSSVLRAPIKYKKKTFSISAHRVLHWSPPSPTTPHKLKSRV